MDEYETFTSFVDSDDDDGGRYWLRTDDAAAASTAAHKPSESHADTHHASAHTHRAAPTSRSWSIAPPPLPINNTSNSVTESGTWTDEDNADLQKALALSMAPAPSQRRVDAQTVAGGTSPLPVGRGGINDPRAAALRPSHPTERYVKTRTGGDTEVHVPGWFYVRNWRLGEEYSIYDVDGDGACFYSAVAFLIHPRGAAGKMDIKNMTADSLGEADYAQKVQWETSATDGAFGVRSLETWKQAVRSAVAYEADYSTIVALGTTLASLYGIGLCIASTQIKGNLCHSNLSCPMTRTTHPLPCIDKFIFVYHTGGHYMALTVMDAVGNEYRVVPLDMLLQYERWVTNANGDARPHNHERRLKELADHMQMPNCVQTGVRPKNTQACTNTVTMQSLAANVFQLFGALAEK